jgi:hypothetical protein
MKLRTVPTALAAVAAVMIAAGGLTPAYAVPDPPSVINVSTGTAGHVTGDVQTPETDVFVGLQPDHSDAVHLTPEAGSASFDLQTWGYATVTVYAWACTGAAFDENCSVAATSGPDAPTDVTLPEGDPVWFTDATVGPEGSADVTITDAAGGGSLVATWAPGVGSPVDTPLIRGVETALNLSDGDGTVTINRCSTTTPTQCTGLDPATSKALSVDTTPLGVTVSTIAPITASHSSSTFKVTADQAGDYSMTYHLESTGDPGVTVPGTTPASPVTGTLDGSNATAATSVIAPTSLADGTYQLVGTITVTNATYGPYTDVPFSSTAFTIHRHGPLLDSITASPTTIYPLVKNDTTYKSSTKFTITGVGVPEITGVKLYKNSTGAFIRSLTLTPVDSTHATVTWSGLLADASPAPAGLYLLKAFDADGNPSTTVGSVTVSGKKLVLKTWTHTYTPAGTLADKYVGKCSTLRKPSLRGWSLSLGYYANTKCASQTSKDSLISTLHAVFLPKFLPKVAQYVDYHVSVYGGAAKAKPGSKAILRYLDTNGDWSNEKTMSGTLGYHAGTTRTAKGLVFQDHSIGWGVYTGFGYQYDVKSFTVVLHYKVLG